MFLPSRKMNSVSPLQWEARRSIMCNLHWPARRSVMCDLHWQARRSVMCDLHQHARRSVMCDLYQHARRSVKCDLHWQERRSVMCDLHWLTDKKVHHVWSALTAKSSPWVSDTPGVNIYHAYILSVSKIGSYHASFKKLKTVLNSNVIIFPSYVVK